MTITAKFASICPCCNARIQPGSKVEWSKGSKARHVACAQGLSAASPNGTRVTIGQLQSYVASTPSRSYGRRTGCSCGSRENSAGELIPSPRNCRSCEHDA